MKQGKGSVMKRGKALNSEDTRSGRKYVERITLLGGGHVKQHFENNFTKCMHVLQNAKIVVITKQGISTVRPLFMPHMLELGVETSPLPMPLPPPPLKR